MTDFLVDQNFNEHIVDGLTRRDATLDFTHLRDVGLAEAPDPTIEDQGREERHRDRGRRVP
jgi:predicted nuclease of predicted toxin-antitoxin system